MVKVIRCLLPSTKIGECSCCTHVFGVRRRTVFGLGGAMAATLLASAPARAAAGNYEATLINCIDPRFVRHSARYMSTRGLEGRFSHFVIAGGPVAAVDPYFASWHQAFWDNLAVSMDLHRIRRIVALTHRDCGAAKLAFGEAAMANPRAETAAHRASLLEFAAAVRRRHPALIVEGGLTGPAGDVEAFV